MNIAELAHVAITQVVCDDLTVDLANKKVIIAGKTVHVSDKEFQVLAYLAEEKAKGKDQRRLRQVDFLDRMYEGDEKPVLKIIDVFICSLRKKLAKASDGKDYIENVHNRGYALCEPKKEFVS